MKADDIRALVDASARKHHNNFNMADWQAHGHAMFLAGLEAAAECDDYDDVIELIAEARKAAGK